MEDLMDPKKKRMRELLGSLKPTEKADDDEGAPADLPPPPKGDMPLDAPSPEHDSGEDLDMGADGRDFGPEDDDAKLDDIPADRRDGPATSEEFRKSSMGAADITKELTRLRAEVDALKAKKSGKPNDDEGAGSDTPVDVNGDF